MKRVVIIAVLVVVYILQVVLDLSPAQMGYYADCHPINRIWFTFFHANVWHLAVNCYVAWVCLNDRLLLWRVLILLLLVVSFASSWVSNMPTPTIGASAALCAMTGINMSDCRQWLYWALMAVGLVVGFFLPSVNGMAHIATFASGLAAGRVILLYRRLSNDHREATRRK